MDHQQRQPPLFFSFRQLPLSLHHLLTSFDSLLFSFITSFHPHLITSIGCFTIFTLLSPIIATLPEAEPFQVGPRLVGPDCNSGHPPVDLPSLENPQISHPVVS